MLTILYLDLKPNTDEYDECVPLVIEHSKSALGFSLKPEDLFVSILKKGNLLNNDNADSDKRTLDGKELKEDTYIIDDLLRIFKNIEQSTMGTESEEDFNNLFEDMDLTSTKLGKTSAERSILIANILTHLNNIDFKLEDTEADVLGDAYEYLIGEFASGAGKKAGEFYTPQQVSTILAKLVTTDKEELKNVYDPTCGSGSLLLRVKKQVKKVGKFYGQELNRTTYNLCRMNMILHDVHSQYFEIKQDDTLERPRHLHLSNQFDAIV